MKYIIKVGMGYGDGSSAALGFIGSIKYGFMEKAARGEVDYVDKHGDIAINKMFTLENKKKARVYNNEESVDTDVNLLRNNFNGLSYLFVKVPVQDSEAKAMRVARRK